MASVYRSDNARLRVRAWCIQQLEAGGIGHVRHEMMTSAGRTSVVVAGPSPATGAPSVVLLPGTNMNAAMSLAVISALSADWHTVVLDVPGQPGLSSGDRPCRARMAWYGNWLNQALEQAVPGAAVVVGHSLGGAIALAGSTPRITGRVLVSSAGLARLRVSPSLVAASVPWLMRPSRPRAERLLQHMVAPGRPVPGGMVTWMDLVATCCRSSLAPGPLPAAILKERRSIPSVVATGRHDTFLPPHVLGPAARRALGAEVKVVDGAGHLLLEERPDAVAALVQGLDCAR
ncbi:alpha/beta fold hydrolase [Streptomyces sp. H27-C3]|uniref:alpha/beta fold hydrolase n=1 Tax=Streptomyces sp. H27-C3 TaxID=3046305 RepID=UPI0024B88972|nr:alpha/beta fold hydrolase [Streptomyces sp. H27-C3]MDJ0466646.1 alpha/beta fold hydrolase [Streptomyces sp. H27-C3]